MSMQDLTEGTTFGSYRIVSVIGRGGMGVVYLAEETGLERRVALKVLAHQYTTDAAFRARFERESRLAASLDHPNVVPVYEAGEIGGVLFIAMRYVSGADLRVVIDRDGQFNSERALGISAQIAGALDAAHGLGLIHRDVKPANVLLSDRRSVDGGEHIYLTDFGLTKHAASKSGLTQLGQLVGTIDYIAPEQIAGGAIDGRADIYALGCVFFEMLTGKPPFLRDTDLATMAAHLHEPPPSLTALRPDLPPAADELVARVLAKDPGQRYPTAAEFVHEARRDLMPDLRPTAQASGRDDPTVVVAASIAAQATVAPPPVAVPPPSSLPPPDIGAFATSGGAPPSFPAGAQANPPPTVPPRPGRSLPMALVVAAIGLGILLVGGVALAFIGAPHATPTLIARASPSGPPSLAPTSLTTPAPSASLLAPAVTTTPTLSSPPTSPAPTAAITSAPTLIATATPTASATPTATPTPSATPTPTATASPATAYERLIAMLNPGINPETTCSPSTETVFGLQPVSRAKCTTGQIERDYMVLENAKQLDTVWKRFAILPRNTCPGYESMAWQYGNDPAGVSRGKVACGLPGGLPQLVFTYDELDLIAVFQDAAGSTKENITAAFTNDNGVMPQ